MRQLRISCICVRSDRRLTIVTGRRQEVIDLLSGSTRDMPGCSSYVIAKDAAAANVLWVTERWECRAAHDASFGLPAVQVVVPQVKPLIAKFEKIATTDPVAGVNGQEQAAPPGAGR